MADNLSDWWSLLNNLASGAAGIVGTLAGILFERALKSRGRLTLHVENWELRYYGQDSSGAPVQVEPGKAEWFEYSFRLEAFNSAEDPNGLRAVRVLFEKGGRVVWTTTPRDSSTTRLVAHQYRSDEIAVVPLPSKEWATIGMQGHGDESLLGSVRTADAVYLEALRPSGKKLRHLVTRLPAPRAGAK